MRTVLLLSASVSIESLPAAELVFPVVRLSRRHTSLAAISISSGKLTLEVSISSSNTTDTD